MKLTLQQTLRGEKLGECLWPGERLPVDEVARRVLLEYLLWAESEREMVEGGARVGPGTLIAGNDGDFAVWYSPDVAVPTVDQP